MAEKLDSFDFGHRQGLSKYPFAEWFDGGVWKLKRGEDFSGTLKTFRSFIYRRAAEHGKSVRTAVDETEGLLILQATDRSTSEGSHGDSDVDGSDVAVPVEGAAG